jgi:putative protein kinase ArgK-like GTPase of G3E family
MANLKIPVEINEFGRFVLLNKYTKTDVYSIYSLPPEGEESLHDKITNFLKNNQYEEKTNLEKLKRENELEKEKEKELEKEKEKELEKEKYLKINKNDMKMRKHSNVVSFKNLGRKTASIYTRKSYDQAGLSPL